MSIAIARQFSICGLCVALAAGCTLSPPPATPAPTTTAKDSTKLAAAAISWKPRRSPGSWRYQLHSTATVTLTGDTTASAVPVSVARTTVYTVRIAPAREPAGRGVPFEVTGSVDSVAVTTPARVPTPTAGSDIRPHFRGDLASDGRLANLTSDATTACREALDPLSAAAVTLFVTLPPAISAGASWKDTVVTVTCRGRMAVITTAIRQYKVVSDTVLGKRPALLLTRTDSLHVQNRPDTTAGAEQMMAKGASSGAFVLYVDPKSGMLLNATGQSHTEILVVAGSSRFPFREDARQTIALLE